MSTSKRRLVYVLNPAAGQGRYLPDARRHAEEHHADQVHMTEAAGECIDFIAEACIRDPHTHFVVYGGDGTAGEAVNGIMRAGAGELARFTMMSAGSGNDFIRGVSEIPVPEGADSIPLDLIMVNGRYAINIANVGFDCAVVAASEALRRKRFMNNSLSYICGVITELSKKETFHTEMKLSGVVHSSAPATPSDETFSGNFLLCAMGNLPYYGGGFKALPAASPLDGMLDVLVVKDVTRAEFLSLVGGFRSGKHINPETWTAYPKFAPYLEYRRCRSISFNGIEKLCLDGEIIPVTGVRAEAAPAAIRYIPG